MTDARPNILFLMPDQLRWDFVGAYGQPHARTPNIDALAESGVIFERCLSPSPLCIPARASMLTGHNALSTGVLNNNYWLRPDHDVCGVKTFARLLSECGYHTEAIGKMHFIPWDISEGFDHRVIAEDKRHIHIQDDYHDFLYSLHSAKPSGPSEPEYVKGRMASIGVLPKELQVDTWVGEQCCKFLEGYDDDKPFFLWSAFPGPHDPYNPPADILAEVAAEMPPAFAETDESAAFRADIIEAHSKGSAGVDISSMPTELILRIRQHYQALVSIIDAQIGAILAAFDARDDGRDTLVVFASDHGDFLGDFGFLGKTLFFESSMRVPMIVRRSNIDPFRVVDCVSLTDVFATFTAAAGLSPPRQDSEVLPGIGLGDANREFVMGAAEKGYMIADNRWKLCRYRNSVCSLHDVIADPAEQRNLWADPAQKERRDRMDCKLQSWVLASVIDGHGDKAYPYMTMTPDHPGHQRGWHRSYPANSWEDEISRGAH
ncbi:MAG: sulfatase family protein [Boseongicola sp.]